MKILSWKREELLKKNIRYIYY